MRAEKLQLAKESEMRKKCLWINFENYFHFLCSSSNSKFVCELRVVCGCLDK
jgi:hypothetical protein